jgi:TonB-dependent receptor
MDFALLPNGFDQPNNFTGSVEDSLRMHQSAPMRPSSVTDDIAQSMALNVGNTFEVTDGIRLGVVLGLTQSNQNVYQDSALGRGYQFDDFSTPTVGDPVLNNTRRTESFARELNFGAMTNVNLEFGDLHDVSFNYFNNDSFADTYYRTSNSYSLINGVIFTANPVGETDPNTGEIVRVFATPLGGSDFFEPLERSLKSTQMKGSHVIYGDKERGGTFKWMVSDATSTESRPHSRTYSFTQLDFTDAERITPVIFDPSQFRPDFGTYTGAGDPILISGFPFVNVFRETLKTVDEGNNQRADVYLPFYFDDVSDDRFAIRLGYNSNNRTREVRGRFYTYDFTRINDSLLLENSLGVYQGNYGQLFHDLFNSGYYPNTQNPFFGNQGININDFSGNGSTIRNIDAGSSIDSYYLGSEVVAGGWTVAGGFRLERENRSYQILPGLNPSIIANPEPVEFDVDTVLPGAVATKSIGKNDKHLITAGFSRTVARPTFYEFAPAFIVNQATGDITRGNPDLVNSSITNYDVRYDCKINEATSAGVGLFLKDIEKPIVDAFDPVLSAQSWLNGDSGTLKGVELEFNTLLANHYRIGANYTFIQSDLEYSLQNQTLTTGFTGQPEHIFNVIASYELEDQGFSANLSYNFTGEFMAAAPTAANAPSIMQESYQTLDFNIQQVIQMWNCDVKVTFGVGNLLDSSLRQYFSSGGFTFREVKPGRTYNISCQVSF